MREGDGAFYGPKLAFIIRDAIGREWGCATLQLDFNLPERLDAAYIGEDGAKHRPVMLHRAILGTFERFIGILLESYAGKLPRVAGAGAMRRRDDHRRGRCLCAGSRSAQLQATGIRAELDLRNEKINYKVREHSLAKVPVMFVVGRREAEERMVSIRRLGEQAQEHLSLETALSELAAKCAPPF